MQGFLYTVDPNQGKSGLATFIVHIYGTAIRKKIIVMNTLQFLIEDYRPFSNRSTAELKLLEEVL